MTIPAPRWDLSNVYPSLESSEFKAVVADYKKQVAESQDYFDEVVAKATANTAPQELASIIGDVVDRFNIARTLSATIVPFIHSYVTTDSRDKLAMKTLSEFEQASLPMH